MTFPDLAPLAEALPAIEAAVEARCPSAHRDPVEDEPPDFRTLRRLRASPGLPAAIWGPLAEGLVGRIQSAVSQDEHCGQDEGELVAAPTGQAEALDHAAARLDGWGAAAAAASVRALASLRRAVPEAPAVPQGSAGACDCLGARAAPGQATPGDLTAVRELLYDAGVWFPRGERDDGALTWCRCRPIALSEGAAPARIVMEEAAAEQVRVTLLHPEDAPVPPDALAALARAVAACPSGRAERLDRWEVWDEPWGNGSQEGDACVANAAQQTVPGLSWAAVAARQVGPRADLDVVQEGWGLHVIFRQPELAACTAADARIWRRDAAGSWSPADTAWARPLRAPLDGRPGFQLSFGATMPVAGGWRAEVHLTGGGRPDSVALELRVDRWGDPERAIALRALRGFPNHDLLQAWSVSVPPERIGELLDVLPRARDRAEAENSAMFLTWAVPDEEVYARVEDPLVHLAIAERLVWREVQASHPAALQEVVDAVLSGAPTSAKVLRDLAARVEEWPAGTVARMVKTTRAEVPRARANAYSVLANLSRVRVGPRAGVALRAARADSSLEARCLRSIWGDGERVDGCYAVDPMPDYQAPPPLDPAAAALLPIPFAARVTVESLRVGDH